jgi:nanoRNase/pAp phosphatase (c-di-AMP/oligoRNAs hydrolase)
MRRIFVAADDFLWTLTSDARTSSDRALYVVEEASSRARIRAEGGDVLAGRLDAETVYRRAFRSGHEPVVLAVKAARRGRVLAAIRRVAGAAPILVLAEDEPSGDTGTGITTLPTRVLLERVIEPELERTATRARVDRIRRLFARADRVLIMMQDDPDPDAIASALALRTLLARTKSAAPLATFGAITRPENRAMTRILEIDVEQIKPRNLGEFDAIAMVDAQPSFFEESFDELDLVIDHHPEEVPVRARLRDIRPSYGATSTILTEYLRAADTKLSPRLATALLYGIKADTLHLERGATRSDMEAFAHLHALANHNALRRIERPDLPNEAFDVLALGIARRRLEAGVVFSHLGPVAYPELVAQFADLFLQIEGAEWAVVSGTVNGMLHVSVRNVGYVRAAGDVVRQAFGDLGSAGGHRSMAKAVIRLREARVQLGSGDDESLRHAISTRFLRALRSS